MIRFKDIRRFIVFVTALCSAQAAYSAERFALVIGNGDYKEIGKLANPINDARAIAQQLDGFGFKRLDVNGEVTTGILENLDRRSFLRAVNSFERAVRSAEEVDMVFIYFAGHGMQRAGRPYLLPVDVPSDDVDLAFEESVELNALLSRLDGLGNLTIAVFDACREIPQLEGMAKRSGYGGASVDFRGLARVTSNGRSRLVAYSGASGELVSDGAGRHSPYTQTLLTAMETPGRPIEDLFQDTAFRFSQNFGGQSPEVLVQGVQPNRFYLARAEPAVVDSPPSYAQQESSMGLTRGEKQTVQSALNASGINIGDADGIWGQRTRSGIESWQSQMGITTTGYLDESSYKQLVAALVLPDQLLADTMLHRLTEPEMVRILGGSFEMGSRSEGSNDERPPRSVRVPTFNMGKYEVTFDQYDAYARSTGESLPDDKGWGRGSRPVINVSWEDAQGYISWLNVNTAGGYRLPSEAEWEYAARAGSKGPWSFSGKEESDLCVYGNGWSSQCSDGYDDETAPVGSFRANGNGLHDVHGNVWEWTEDCWNKSYDRSPIDGSAWIQSGDCGRRVLRGGSWGDFPDDLRSANRFGGNMSDRGYVTGFRLSSTLTP